MWPQDENTAAALANPQALISVYGAVPVLESIEITKFCLDREGPTLTVDFCSLDYPANPPAKWKNANAVAFEVQFLAISISVSSFLTQGDTFVRIVPANQYYEIYFTGAVSAKLNFHSFRIAKISPYLDERKL